MSRLFLSFKYAMLGVFNAIRYELNFRLMWVLAVLVCFFNSIFTFSHTEQICFIAAILLVLVSELFNSSIERLCNLYSSKSNRTIKIIKDLSSGAVLVLSIGALILFLIILWKNISLVKPWLFVPELAGRRSGRQGLFYIFAWERLDFILFFLFTFHQGIKGRSSFIDAASSVITLIFIVSEFHNIFWALSGISAFVVWQFALILNAMEKNAFKVSFGKNRSSL